MKKIVPILLVFLSTALLIVSCQQGPKDISAEIQEANDHFRETYRKGDPDAMTNLYTNDAVIYPPNSPAIRGAENIREFWKATYGSGITDAELQTIKADGYGNHAIEEGLVKLFVDDMLAGEDVWRISRDWFFID